MSNSRLVSGFENNLETEMTTLLDKPPPDANILLTEESGVGSVYVFIQRTLAEFSTKDGNPGDETVLHGLQANLRRVASNFFWASFICNFISDSGVLMKVDEDRLNDTLVQMLIDKVVTIPDIIVPALLKFMRFTIMGALHLNQFAAGCSSIAHVQEPSQVGSVVQKRLISRLAEGLLAIKKRKFTLSKLMESFADYSRDTLLKEIPILTTQSVVWQRTRVLS